VTDRSATGRAWWWPIALVAIGAVAAALRFVGLSWGLPFALHPDEPIILERALRMSWSNLDPGFYIYPGFFIYQVFLLGRAVLAMGGEYAGALFAARLLTATYGLSTVLFVYLLGARLGGRRLGAMAALLVALSGPLALHAHYAVTDTPATALATAAVWLSVRGWQRRSFAVLAAAAGLAGLAVSTKYSVAPVCLVPWLAAMAMAAEARTSLAARAGRTAALAAVALATFVATSPYTVLSWPDFLADMGLESRLQAQARAGMHVAPLESPALVDRGLVGNALALYEDLGAAALVLALGSLLVLIASLPGALRALRGGHREQRAPALHVADASETEPDGGAGPAIRSGAAPSPTRASHPATFPTDIIGGVLVALWLLAFYAFMAPSAIAGQRYMLPIHPGMMLLAAIAIEGMMRTYAARGHRRVAWAGGALLLVLAAAPSFGAAESTRLLARRDNRLVARDWMLDNLPPRSHIAREFYAPMFDNDDPFRFSQPFSLTEHPLETYCKERVDYLVLSSLNAERYFADETDRFAEQRTWYERLDTRTRVVQRIGRIGDLPLHHPEIEIRRLFCNSD